MPEGAARPPRRGPLVLSGGLLIGLATLLLAGRADDNLGLLKPDGGFGAFLVPAVALATVLLDALWRRAVRLRPAAAWWAWTRGVLLALAAGTLLALLSGLLLGFALGVFSLFGGGGAPDLLAPVTIALFGGLAGLTLGAELFLIPVAGALFYGLAVGLDRVTRPAAPVPAPGDLGGAP